ncbi:MAG: nitroreductase family protein [Myxococcales bacterium]|nr:nitroreductase family protein [Myxococcales bacterium]
MTDYPHVPYALERYGHDELISRARAFYTLLDGRRSVRFFSTDPVPREAIELAVATASTAPSGANKQPWTFVAVDDPELKRRIREAAEEEEQRFYAERATPEWLEDLAPIGTDWRKPFIEDAPYVIVCFLQAYALNDDGSRAKHYYTAESVGIAVGMLIAALHNMGLATLTHTPSPMGFLARLLERPANERPYVLLPVGYVAENATVPDIARKPLDEVLVWNRGE